jgi:hypothetical protein
MDVKDFIVRFENNEKDLLSKIKSLKEMISNEKELWNVFGQLNNNFFLNDKAINFFADCLQTANDEDLLLTYSLDDIKRIYELLVYYNPSNMQYHEDLISFVYNVLDDEEEALLLANNAEKMLAVQEKSLRHLIKKIKDNG